MRDRVTITDETGWRIASTTPAPSTVPSQEEMEALLPSSWPNGWEELGRDSTDGRVRIKLGHVSPAPRYATELGVNIHTLQDTPPGLRVSKYDFTADLRIAYVQDSETFMLDPEGLKSHVDTELSEAQELLASLGDDLPADKRADLMELLAEATEFAGTVEDIQYLGQRARGKATDDGDIHVLSVTIGRFSLHGTLIGSDRWPEPGSTRIHSAKCYANDPDFDHKPCSTLAKEGFVTQEAVERLLKRIFARVEGKDPAETNEEEPRANVVVRRRAEAVEDPEKGLKIANGDTVETRRAKATLKDRMGNQLSLENDTRVVVAQASELEQSKGKIRVRVRSLTRDQMRIRTPQAVTSVRGTTFSVRVQDDVTTLTVHEGEVEFTDLHGSAVTVNADQRCTCSVEHGLSLPTSP
ncbi:MAG: FecR family protein [Longimicrobiales bacterium]